MKFLYQTFFITNQAMKTLLGCLRASFAKIEFIDTGHKGRYIAIGHMRRIGNLIVVAGLQASGKSTLIENITSVPRSMVAAQLGLDQTKNWSVQYFGKFAENEEAYMPNVVLHYNISKHLIDGDLYHHNRALADIMATADKVTIVTVWCPRERLLQQFIEGRVGKRKKSGSSRRHRMKIKKLTDLYQNQAAFNAVFDEWLAFARARPDPGFVVAYDDAYRVSSTAVWKAPASAAN